MVGGSVSIGNGWMSSTTGLVARRRWRCRNVLAQTCRRELIASVYGNELDSMQDFLINFTDSNFLISRRKDLAMLRYL